VHVTFMKHDAKRRGCSWEAVIGKRTRVPARMMGPSKGIPHDIAQYVIEAATGYDGGFWGCVARGATFKSTTRKRTKPGRAVIARHRASIVASEHLANQHMLRWYTGERSPVSDALDRAMAQWQGMRDGDRLAFVWPSPTGDLEQA
jgi:hypothetical protein